MFIVEIIVAISIVLSDILLKNIAQYVIADASGGVVTVIPGFFSFAYAENKGAAWSILSDATWLLTIISFFASAGLIIFLFKTKNKSKFMRMSVNLIFAGAVGNLYDRMFLGYVRDMLRFDFIDFPIFNIADAAMVIGVILLIVYVIFIYKEPNKINVVDGADAININDNSETANVSKAAKVSDTLNKPQTKENGNKNSHS